MSHDDMNLTHCKSCGNEILLTPGNATESILACSLATTACIKHTPITALQKNRAPFSRQTPSAVPTPRWKQSATHALKRTLTSNGFEQCITLQEAIAPQFGSTSLMETCQKSRKRLLAFLDFKRPLALRNHIRRPLHDGMMTHTQQPLLTAFSSTLIEASSASTPSWAPVHCITRNMSAVIPLPVALPPSAIILCLCSAIDIILFTAHALTLETKQKGSPGSCSAATADIFSLKITSPSSSSTASW
mmetsp:Transcript_41311/g.101415  ORF Transcript_41311/g.101415 Transcript_41311/m.101415 type:complete len:246 (-) Transcript_41311:733-1470(-)